MGGLVEPLVGGVFRAPGAFGGAREMGKEVEEEEGELRRPVGGQEQTGENPLGLDRGGK